MPTPFEEVKPWAKKDWLVLIAMAGTVFLFFYIYWIYL